jgi:hypothetical protein
MHAADAKPGKAVKRRAAENVVIVIGYPTFKSSVDTTSP